MRAGADSIEHGTYLDDEGIRLMKKKGAYLVPTLSAVQFATEKAKIDGFFPEMVRLKVFKVAPQMKGTLGRAYKKGVNIAFGTDAGVSAHGTNAEEFALMVDAGMTPAHALQAATRNTARLLRIEDQLGSIETGKLADIVAVTGNPLADISLMNNVSFVMKGGEIFKQ